ncbi:glucose-6-phosphate exchanger SLC37A1 isoform X1 [Corvus cornix cornix]|uniref:Solute carrier family 37 member 1 n=1 Tax=Corvus moneduloides TaxID=1196302 RepID=A0A8C3E6H9_CORMO|nr:PREDICTED: glucose-6-phosphate exchanger SLC37A1 isoform X1 [Corvus brachyrhynchos]XP_017588814.1 PREDICTED: glucose-6-phosphate exchanger SLC37A1 isoform X1 [Corvus brachyrhynchos]XP_017588815.1 PREDICTED: glucose-6-phosphate exchanger SLC37A1 isoform X1 [Corvus brachyrhynchos]XP_031956942.1 glucose-6-phosphate exchanger SLC37A1 isoform X1 [Corvus moneduloides]XP_031956943.1 glucose-6-phosphate exchanger SLC37A1 isoform X1 [Corvus moneduloides]XP_031956944.1 glucose-6-phosphate exchanger S
MAQLPPGIRFITSFSRDQWYRAFIFSLTFLLYASFHLSRKPISIVKGELHKHCAASHEVEVDSYKEYAAQIQPVKKPFNASQCGWEPFDKSNYKQLLGALDYSFLCAYAVGMYLSGLIGERLPIRYYLTGGMLASGLFTAMFGLGYFYNVHNLWFYIMAQVSVKHFKVIQSPLKLPFFSALFDCKHALPYAQVEISVVLLLECGEFTSLLSSEQCDFWRGLIMGVWNSHTSVGNILGSLIAAYWVSTCWGLSFVVPGVIVAVMGVVCFLFLIEHPRDVSCSCTPSSNSKTFLNGASRCRIQMPALNAKENGKPQDPEMQHLLTDSENCSVSLSSSTVATGEGRHGTSAISFLGALRIPGVVEFSLCLLFAKLVSYTFLFWLPLYITNVEHLDAKRAGDLSTLFDVGGIFGGILAGLISDRLEKRASTCGMMLLLAAPTLYMFSAVSKMGLEATVVMLLISGALVNGPYALITTAVSADLGTHKSLKGNARALSTVTAIIDGTGSVGAALGPLLAGLISPSGWNNVFYMLMVADACALLLLLRLIQKELQCHADHSLFKEH